MSRQSPSPQKRSPAPHLPKRAARRKLATTTRLSRRREAVENAFFWLRKQRLYFRDKVKK